MPYTHGSDLIVVLIAIAIIVGIMIDGKRFQDRRKNKED